MNLLETVGFPKGLEEFDDLTGFIEPIRIKFAQAQINISLFVQTSVQTVYTCVWLAKATAPGRACSPRTWERMAE
jgi:hypothetical protein